MMRVRQEEDLLPARALTAIATALVVIVIGAGLGVAQLIAAREHALRPSGAFPERHLRRPQEQSAIEQETFAGKSEAQRQREQDDAVLRSYGWTDRARGIARIPIERAIELYVAEANRR